MNSLFDFSGFDIESSKSLTFSACVNPDAKWNTQAVKCKFRIFSNKLASRVACFEMDLISFVNVELNSHFNLKWCFRLMRLASTPRNIDHISGFAFIFVDIMLTFSYI